MKLPAINISEKWLVSAGVALLAGIAVVGFAVAVYAAWLFHDLPDASELAEYRPPTATRVYAGDGTLIGEFSDERRIYVPYEQMPTPLVQAFLAAEDRNFFQHGGIDVSGLGRAMLKNVFNFVTGRRLEGGSTITQQVAKNVLLTSESSINRKLKEAILASRLEAALSKEQILELYLNEIFLGYRSYGVASAAYNYFGKSLNQLTVEEAAFLAALPKGPNNYHPKRRHDAAKARRDWVLGEMEQSRFITEAQLAAARAKPLVTNDAPQRAAYRDADFFVEEARRRALGIFGKDINAGGYYMRTTLDASLQTAARQALMKGLENYDRRHGWRGAWGSTDFADGWQAEALKKTTPPERRAWQAAAVESVSGNTVRIRTARDDRTGALVAEDARWANANRPLKRGDLIFVEPTSSGGSYNLRQIPAVNGALVAIEPQTGRVLAMVGGYSYGVSSFNRATQAKRQPGSAFKPFVYASALEGDFTPASVIVDEPVSFPGGPNGTRWTPTNYSGQFYGRQTLRRGLELSLNVATVRLADDVGMKEIVANAAKWGVADDLPANLSVALGAGETTPLRLTAAYSAFVNGGRKVTPYLIELVQDRDGETRYRGDKRDCRACLRGFDGGDSPRLEAPGEQVMDPITAYQISSMLEGVVQRGTAASARGLGRWVGGKTGTTNDYRSAWFVGFSSDIVVGVFIGFDDNRPLGHGETGAATPVPIFIDFMHAALKERPARPFVKPKGAVYRTINGIEEAFRPGTERRDPTPPPPGPAIPDGPVPYLDVIRREQEAQTGETPPPTTAPPPTPPPAKKEPSEDLSGLY